MGARLSLADYAPGTIPTYGGESIAHKTVKELAFIHLCGVGCVSIGAGHGVKRVYHQQRHVRVLPVIASVLRFDDLGGVYDAYARRDALMHV